MVLMPMDAFDDTQYGRGERSEVVQNAFFEDMLILLP